MIKRNELVLEVLSIYDLVDMLQKENAKLKLPTTLLDKEDSPLVGKVYEIGLKTLFKDSYSSYNSNMRVERDEDDNDIIKCTTFDKWLDRVFRASLPNNLNKSEVLELLTPLFEIEYNILKYQVLTEFHAEESNND